MIEIDGSHGEGGGQILRTALALSCLLKLPVRIYNIRKNRSKPGLMPQHLTGVRAASEITSARLSGDSIGSQELVFEPGPTRFGQYFFDIGTAGSTSLLFQTILLPLALSGGASDVGIKGGTHVPWSPPFDYIRDVFLPFMGFLGVNAEARIESCGFYPKGGGTVFFDIRPADCIAAGDFTERGRLVEMKGVSAVANLPMGIARRQRDAAVAALGSLEADIKMTEVESPGQGTFVFLLARYEHSLAGFSALGEKGKRAETVGEEAAAQFLKHHQAEAALDPHMADQIVLYLALSRQPCEFATSEITEHLLTNLWVLKHFLPVDYAIKGEKGSPGMVSIGR
jgi:RNA 3'-terminal phosphate cyclase (ATP)